jgi:hypothetical protein
MWHARKNIGVPSMRLIGFDGFKGLPPGSEKKDDGVFKAGFYCCSFEQMQECLRRRGVDPDGITWVQGWYDETLKPETAEQLKLDNLAIVMIDCDTYDSSKAVLEFIGPLITEPVIVCLDDWKLYNLDLKGEGEYRSFNEFLERNRHLKAKKIPSYNRKSQSFLVQPA